MTLSHSARKGAGVQTNGGRRFSPNHYVPINMLLPCSGAFLRKVVSLRHDVHEREITGRSRIKHIVAARHEAAYLIARHTRLSMVQVGKLLGGRDHATIVHALSKFPPLKRASYYARRRAEAESS